MKKKKLHNLTSLKWTEKHEEEEEKNCHLFVCKDDASIAVQNGLEGESSEADVVLEVNPVPLNHQCSSYNAHMFIMNIIQQTHKQKATIGRCLPLGLSHHYQSKTR